MEGEALEKCDVKIEKPDDLGDDTRDTDNRIKEEEESCQSPSRRSKTTTKIIKTSLCDDGDDHNDRESSPRKKVQPKKTDVASTRATKTSTSSEVSSDTELLHSSYKFSVANEGSGETSCSPVQGALKICLRPAGFDGIESDDLLYCEECSRTYKGDCPEHGPLLIIEDTPVPADIKDEFRAKKTAPSQVTVANSKIPGAGSGVWAREVIQARTRFGPYDGEVVPADMFSPYAWQMCKNGLPDHCIDASEPGLSNWMRFVNCARHDGEQNLHAFQYRGKLYYRTIRRVVPNEELLVWYGNDYARRLGIDCSKQCNTNYDEANFKCPTCVYAFSSPLYLETHKKVCRQRHLQSANLQPTLDVAATRRKRKDRDKTSRNKTKRCVKCIKKFPNLASLMTHLKTHPDVEQFACSECNKHFVTRAALSVHSRRHSGEKPFVCIHCDKRFVQVAHLTSHLRSHSQERHYQCKECNKRFMRRDHLNSHRLTHQGEKKYVCSECQKRFLRNTDLTKHRETHSKEKPFPCSQCSKTFASKSNLKQHEVVHKGEKPFSCSQCDGKFAHRKTLYHHLRTHFGEKPYVCTECNKRFSLGKTLRNHIKRHGMTKRFECQDCHKSYTHKKNYEAHLLKHKERKEPNVCKECAKVFSSLTNLKRHLVIHSGVKRFACQTCDKRFGRKETLEKHERSHRKDTSFVFVNCDTGTETLDTDKPNKDC